MFTRNHRSLFVLLACYFFLSSLYWIVTPVYEAPDEPMHYAYVRHLIETRRLPALVGYEGGHPAHQETSQPPFYYMTAALLTFWTPDQGDYATLLERNPHFAHPAPPTVPDNKNTWLHTSAERFPWRGTVLAVRLTRLISLLFGALGVLATWGLGGELWPSSGWLPLVAAGLVACIPQFLFMSAVVSNDVAAMALSSCSLWAAVRLARRPASARRAWLLGLLLGLAALTKVSALGLAPLVCLFFVGSAWRKRFDGRVVLGRLALVCGMAALTAGWWYIRNCFLYGAPFNTQVHLASPWAWDGTRPLREALAQMGGVEQSFWGMFGVGNIGLPGWVYGMLRVGWLLALMGWILLLWRGLRGRAEVWVLLWVWFLLILALQVRWMQLVLAPWGRLLYPALSAVACLLVEGWRGWLPSPAGAPSKGVAALPSAGKGAAVLPSIVRGRCRFIMMTGGSGAVALLVPVVGLLLLSVIVPLTVIRPAYARPAQLTYDQVIARVQPVDFRLGDLVDLIGYDLDRASVSPDEWLTVTLCWEVVGRTTDDYTLFVQLIGMDGRLVSSRHTYSGQGSFPTSQWRPGDRFCDETRVYVDPHAPGPAVYQMEVGMLNAEGNERLLVRTSDGPFDRPLFITRVRVAPEDPPHLDVPVPLDYRLGETLALAGRGAIPDAVRAGESFSLMLYWKATADVVTDYVAFVHLVDQAGKVVAQIDRPPRDGSYPTSFWIPGEIVSDTFTLEVPATALPGEHRLVCGMYSWPDLVRLPVFGPDKQRSPESLIELGNILVE